MGSYHDGPGTKEQGDLPEGVHDDVHASADDPPFVGQESPEDDVGELADGGVGQACFQIVLREGHQGSEDDGGCGNPEE